MNRDAQPSLPFESTNTRKQPEPRLEQLEWMLHETYTQGDGEPADEHDQGYGDLTELNHDGIILKSIGRDQLGNLAEDYLELLGTSSAIYEANGDYAFGIFTSGWCRMMDSAARKLCDTSDNAEALKSGCWLCHESCWTDCSKRAIAQREPVDVECNGGIRMYAAPIFAQGDVVGAIVIAYGDPPTDPEKLRTLAATYHVDYDDLVREAAAYDSRPPFIIELAKKRLNATARLIGSIIETKQAEEEKENLRSQLLWTQKMESVGRLAGGVAHDFNNMLQAILGHSEAALEQVDPEQPLFADIDEIRKAAEHSADLTRQLLAFAREQTIAPRMLDLNETVEGMLAMLRRLVGEDIELRWKPCENLNPVKMDPSQVNQILANLCINARDSIDGVGKITIETGASVFDEFYCAAHAEVEPAEYVLLAVSDDGCGMDAEIVDHLFEPFFTTKSVSQGTGLGLASVYGAVKQNGGFINVYSQPHLGTTFKVYLPSQQVKSDRSSTDDSQSPPHRGSETILLVEDEPSILKITTMMLEKMGYTVMAAATPDEAIRLANEHSGRIDLLVTDVVMPEMNGRDLAENLHALFPDLKRLFMSGYTADIIAQHGVLGDSVHFLQKPFSSRGLADKVRESLR